LINLDKTQQTLIKNGYNQLYKFKYKIVYDNYDIDTSKNHDLCRLINLKY
jgi:hypothetical protein